MNDKHIVSMLEDVKGVLQLALKAFWGKGLEADVDDPVEFEAAINQSASKLNDAITVVLKSGALTPENIVEVEDAVHNALSNM